MQIFHWQDQELDQLLQTVERDGLIPYIEKYVPKTGQLLESGAGGCRYVKYLHDRGWNIIGLELSPETVKKVKAHWPELDVVEGDCANSPYPDNRFDGIISIGVVEHWPDGPQAPLQEMLRTLKPGGYAFMTVPCHNVVRRLKRLIWWPELVPFRRHTAAWLIKHRPSPNRFKKGYKNFVIYPTYGDFFEYRMTPKQFATEVKTAGYEIVHHLPNQVIDGFFHELNPKQKLVQITDWQFKASKPVWFLNRLLGRWPFFHPHMQLIVGRKPLK